MQRALSKRFGLPAPLLTSGASAGLYFVLKILTGRKIYLPAYTCRALIEACFFAGRIDDVCLVDIDLETFGMNLDALDNNIVPGSIIVATHQFGIPADMHRVRTIANRTNSVVIEDNAAAFGARLFGRATGTFGDVALLSFDYTKTLSACGGGAVFFRDAALQHAVEQLMRREMYPAQSMAAGNLLRGLLYNVATQENIYGRVTFPLWKFLNGPYQDHGELRTDRLQVYRKPFGALQARTALQALDRIDSVLARRKQIESIYSARLKGHPSLATYTPLPESETALLMFPIRVTQGEKIIFHQQCAAQGVDLGFTFSYVNKLGKGIGQLANSQLAAAQVLNVPLYSKLTDKHIDRVCKIVLCHHP